MPETLTLNAPLSGVIYPLERVPDPVFAQKLVGDGVSIDPTDSCLHAPCAGEVTHLHAAGHAVTLRNASGVEVLMHIGIDTVALKGDGFTARVKVGDPQTGREFVAITRDLSVGGLGLIQSVMAVSGELFDVTLPRARETPLKVRCRVTYASQWADGVWAVGAQFVSLVTPKPAASKPGASTPALNPKQSEAQRIQRELLS